MNVHIEVVEPKLFAAVAADEIVACIQDAVAERGQCFIALAGGSTPSAIYRMLSKPPRVAEVDWNKVHLFMGDERWVPHDDNQSNAKMIQETLIAPIAGPKPHLYPVLTSMSSPVAGASAYSKTIRTTSGLVENGAVVFDLVLLGMGEDGHTASLFPQSKLIKDSGGEICAAVAPHEPGGSRVTLTPMVLASGRRVLFLVSGESKAQMLRRVLEGSEDLTTLPARLYTLAKTQVTWFVDSSAAQRLSREMIQAGQ